MLFLEAPVKCGGFLQNGHGVAEGGLGWGLWPPPVLVMVHTPRPCGRSAGGSEDMALPA